MDIEGIIAIIAVFSIPIIVVSSPIIAIILIVYFFFRAQRNRQAQQAELYAKAMEQGKELPANFFQPAYKRNLLNRGIMWAMVGIGVGVFFALNSSIKEGVALGAIPFCVGLAYLLIHFIGKKQNSHEQR